MIAPLIQCEWHLAWRRGGDSILPLGFFVLAAGLFPLALGPDSAQLAKVSGGVIWVLALLAVLLSLDRFFALDAQDGTLPLFALSPLPLSLLVLAKVLVHWLTTGLPVILLAPVLSLLLHFPAQDLGYLIGGLLLGTPTLSLIGAMGAALSLGARRAGLLTILLVLPFYAPVLIFAMTALQSAAKGLTVISHFSLLAALLALGLALTPLATAAALRQAVRYR